MKQILHHRQCTVINVEWMLWQIALVKCLQSNNYRSPLYTWVFSHVSNIVIFNQATDHCSICPSLKKMGRILHDIWGYFVWCRTYELKTEICSYIFTYTRNRCKALPPINPCWWQNADRSLDALQLTKQKFIFYRFYKHNLPDMDGVCWTVLGKMHIL